MSTVRETPRISVNQLGLYLVAGAAKRRTIINEQKRPKTFMVNWYEPAQNVVSEFFLGGAQDISMIEHAIADMDLASCDKRYAESRLRTNAEALGCVLSSYQLLDVSQFKIASGHDLSPKIHLNGVSISVRPDCVYQHKNKIGIIKFYYSKDSPIGGVTEDVGAGVYIASILKKYTQDNLLSTGLSLGESYVYDVFSQKFYRSPSAWVRRYRDVEAACQEIARAWEEA